MDQRQSMSQWRQVVSMPRYMNQITACKTNGVIFLLGMCEPLARMLCSTEGTELPEGCGTTKMVSGLENMTCEE